MRSINLSIGISFGSLFFLIPALGQTICQPVQYQFGGQNRFYYGGGDAAVIRAAEMPRSADGRFGRTRGFAFSSGNLQTHRDVVTEPLRVFSDYIPGQNAALFGATPDLARNEAYARRPTYFRMADLDRVPHRADLAPQPR